jgi:NTE family protein
MLGHGCSTVIHFVRLVAPRLPDEDHTKDLDFNRARIDARWHAGVRDARRAIARAAWLAPVDAMQGLVLHEQDAGPEATNRP